MPVGRAARSILALIGNTPLIPIEMADLPPGVELYGKAEWFNPGGSVKDRAALYMVEDGERSGALGRGKTILDATSGNTGVAYALIGAAKGYPVELVMPGNVSQERLQIVAAYGAQVVLTDPLEGIDGAILEARHRHGQDPARYFYPDQYNNLANPQAHYETTGREILDQTEAEVTHLVCGIGTSGTLMGTGRRLKEHDPQIGLIAVEPAEELQIIEGLKHMASSIVPGIYDPRFPDRVVPVDAEEAHRAPGRLARDLGLFVGLSSGAAVAAAVEVAADVEEGVVVVILPDGGERYLSLSHPQKAPALDPAS